MEQKILTPISLWKGFDDTLPLKESVISSVSINSITLNRIYFSARSVDNEERVRVYGVYAKNLINSKGSILIIPDIFEEIDTELIIKYASLGYDVISIDLQGYVENKVDYTKYPTKIAYANSQNANEHMYYVTKTAKETSWYEWCAVCRYAVSYLKNANANNPIGVLGVKNSSMIAFMLSAIDKRVNASCNLFGGGWLAYKGINKSSSEEIVMDEERYRFLGGVDAQAYSQFITCPLLFLTTTNNKNFDFERAMDTLQYVNNQDDLRYNFVSYGGSILDVHCFNDTVLFFNKYLGKESVFYPKQPQIKCYDTSSEVFYEVSNVDKKNLKSIHLLTANALDNSSERVWFKVYDYEINEDGNYLFSRQNYENYNNDLSFVVVAYKNGLTISSRLNYYKIENLSKLKKPSIIYTSDKFITSFVAKNLKSKIIGNLFAEGDLYHRSVGPNDIVGVFSINELASYRIKELNGVIKSSSSFKLDIYSAIDTTITLKLLDKSNNEYFAYKKLNGGEFWQNILINISDFKTNEGLMVMDISNLVTISVSSVGEFGLNNFILL